MNDVQMKICCGCAHRLPVEEFRHHRDGEARESRCRECHVKYMREYRAERRVLSLLGFARSAKWRTNRRYLDKCCHQMVASFGGVEAFAAEFAEHYHRLKDLPGQNRESADLLLAALRLLDVTSRSR